jgi:excinuclease ABC subunit A
LRLGQSATTMSGGESQRMKLAAELALPSKTEAIYLLDEPSTGLHLKDLQPLWQVIRGLAERGSTVVFVEHHPDLIAHADWSIELGPEGGDGGGYLQKMEATCR